MGLPSGSFAIVPVDTRLSVAKLSNNLRNRARAFFADRDPGGWEASSTCRPRLIDDFVEPEQARDD